MKALMIYATGSCRVIDAEDSQIRGLIGGYLEGIVLDGAVMYVDEEGRVKRLHRNDVASIVWQKHTRRVDKPFIVGPALILGLDDGESVDVPQVYLTDVGL